MAPTACCCGDNDGRGGPSTSAAERRAAAMRGQGRSSSGASTLLVVQLALQLALLGGHEQPAQARGQAAGQHARVDPASLLIVNEGICLVDNLLLCWTYSKAGQRSGAAGAWQDRVRSVQSFWRHSGRHYTHDSLHSHTGPFCSLGFFYLSADSSSTFLQTPPNDCSVRPQAATCQLATHPQQAGPCRSTLPIHVPSVLPCLYMCPLCRPL